MEPITLGQIESFFKEMNINYEYVNIDKYGFSRCIQFTIYTQTYTIEWYKNQSTLFVGINRNIAPQIPFRYIYFDRTYPHVNGNKTIGFTQFKHKKESFFDTEYPYEAFRIPIETEF